MFVDTNILVNARILEAPHHESARAGLERALRGPEPLRISRQVMREYLVVVTRPQAWPVAISRAEALSDVNRLAGSFEVLEDGPRVTEVLVRCAGMPRWEEGRFTTPISWPPCWPTASDGCSRSMPRTSGATETTRCTTKAIVSGLPGSNAGYGL